MEKIDADGAKPEAADLGTIHHAKTAKEERSMAICHHIQKGEGMSKPKNPAWVNKPKLHAWLNALRMRTNNEDRKAFLNGFYMLYMTRRKRRLRSMFIETHIADQWRMLEERKLNLYVWRNDMFFRYSGDKKIVAFQRRPRKNVNTYQIRRMLSERITPGD